VLEACSQPAENGARSVGPAKRGALDDFTILAKAGFPPDSSVACFPYGFFTSGGQTYRV